MIERFQRDYKQFNQIIQSWEEFNKISPVEELTACHKNYKKYEMKLKGNLIISIKISLKYCFKMLNGGLINRTILWNPQLRSSIGAKKAFIVQKWTLQRKLVKITN